MIEKGIKSSQLFFLSGSISNALTLFTRPKKCQYRHVNILLETIAQL